MQIKVFLVIVLQKWAIIYYSHSLTPNRILSKSVGITSVFLMAK